MGNEAQTSCSKTLFPIIGYDNIFLCSLGATEITSVINFVEVVAKPQRVRCDIMCERVGSASYWSGFRGSALLVRLEECILGTDSSPAASGGATAAFPDMKVWFLALRTAAALAEDTAVASTPCLCLPPPSLCSPDFPYTFHSQWVPQPTEPRGVPWAAVSPPLVLCQVFVTSFPLWLSLWELSPWAFQASSMFTCQQGVFTGLKYSVGLCLSANPWARRWSARLLSATTRLTRPDSAAWGLSPHSLSGVRSACDRDSERRKEKLIVYFKYISGATHCCCLEMWKPGQARHEESQA